MNAPRGVTPPQVGRQSGRRRQRSQTEVEVRTTLPRVPVPTVDLRVEYAVTADWTVQARASNVFDREYETIAWYNQRGREYGLSLRYQPAR